MDGRLDQEVSRARELRAALAAESLRIERNLVEYRRRVGLARPDDDDAEFDAQAAYRERRDERTREEA
jgi:hypothetical protein